MARFIIDNKVFDTETAESVIEYFKSYPTTLITGHTIYIKKETTLYKTTKGNWFSVSKEDYGKLKGHAESEESAKELLKQLNEIEIYNAHFENLEEA